MVLAEYTNLKAFLIRGGYEEGLRKAEPDINKLAKIAENYDITPQALCEQLADASGDSQTFVCAVIVKGIELGRL